MKTTLLSILAFLCAATPCYAQVYDDQALDEDYNSYYIPGVPSDYVDQYQYSYNDAGSNAVVARVQGTRAQGERYANRPPRYIGQDRLPREQTETQVMRERVRRRHMDNSIGRDDSYTDLYESNTRASERTNIMRNINEASDTVRNISNTIKYIENLF